MTGGIRCAQSKLGVGDGLGPLPPRLRRLGLGSDISRWTGVPGAPRGWIMADRTKAESLMILLQAWRCAEWRELAGRRGDFVHVADGVDSWATMRLLNGGVKGCPKLPPDAAGALRTVLSGNVVLSVLPPTGPPAARARTAVWKSRTTSIGSGGAQDGRASARLRLGLRLMLGSPGRGS